MDKNQVKGDWKRRGYSCNQWIDTPLNEYVNLCEEEKIVILVTGTLVLIVDGVKRELLQNEEVVIPTGVVHSLYVGNDTVEWLYGYKKGGETIIDNDRGDNFSIGQKVMDMMVPSKKKKEKR